MKKLSILILALFYIGMANVNAQTNYQPATNVTAVEEVQTDSIVETESTQEPEDASNKKKSINFNKTNNYTKSNNYGGGSKAAAFVVPPSDICRLLNLSDEQCQLLWGEAVKKRKLYY